MSYTYTTKAPVSDDFISQHNFTAEVTSSSLIPTATPVFTVQSTVMIIVAVICSVVTVGGNLLVILSFFVNPGLRYFSNFMILSLAMSDFIIGAFSMNVFIIYNINTIWTFGDTMCKVWLIVDYTASNASVMNLLVICVDRYFAITKPVKYRRWSNTRHAAGWAIAFVWSLSFVMWGPAIILWNEPINEKECSVPFIDNKFLGVLTIVVAFYAPASIMSVLYWRVIDKLGVRRASSTGILIATQKATMTSPLQHQAAMTSSIRLSQQKKLPTEVKSESRTVCCCWQRDRANITTDARIFTTIRASFSRSDSTDRCSSSIRHHNARPRPSTQLYNNRLNRERRVTFLLKCILLCFIVLWLPYSLIVVIVAMTNVYLPESIWNLSYWLCYLNSTANPFCYGLCNENFRRTFKIIVTTRWWTRKSQSQLRHSQHHPIVEQRIGQDQSLTKKGFKFNY